MARIIGVTPMTDSTRLRGTRRHAPHFSQKARAFPSLFLFLASPLPTLPLLPFLILMLYLSHFLFSFFFFSVSLGYLLDGFSLFIHLFFRFVRPVLFNRNLQFLFVIPHHLHIILIHDLYLSNDFSIDS